MSDNNNTANMNTPQDEPVRDDNHETESPDPALDTDLDYEPFSDSLDPVPETPEQPSKDPAERSADQTRITVLEEELARTKDQMIRALAESENARKRAVKDREDASKFAVSKFSRDLLSVADNLRRALEATPHELLEQHPEVKNLTDGIEATERELLRTFEKNGIKKLIPIDEKFDPNFHEVMFEAPMPDKEPGTIVQVIEAGYTLNGRILRPARVGVAKDDGQGSGPPPKEPGQTINTEV